MANCNLLLRFSQRTQVAHACCKRVRRPRPSARSSFPASFHCWDVVVCRAKREKPTRVCRCHAPQSMPLHCRQVHPAIETTLRKGPSRLHTTHSRVRQVRQCTVMPLALASRPRLLPQHRPFMVPQNQRSQQANRSPPHVPSSRKTALTTLIGALFNLRHKRV